MGESSASHRFSRHEAHPFQEASAADDACGLCGEPRAVILHHPTRIRAACLLRGIDPARVLPPRRKGSGAA